MKCLEMKYWGVEWFSWQAIGAMLFKLYMNNIWAWGNFFVGQIFDHVVTTKWELLIQSLQNLEALSSSHASDLIKFGGTLLETFFGLVFV